MIPKLVFFDLDGTIVNREGAISAPVQLAIKKLHALGTRVAFATGRPLFGARRYMELVGVNAPSSFFSAALVYDPVLQKVVHQKVVLPADAQAFLLEARKEGFHIEFYTYDRCYIEEWSDLADAHMHYIPERPVEASLEEIIQTQAIIKISILVRGAANEKRAREFQNKFPQFHYGIATGAAHADLLFINVTDPGTSREIVFDLILSTI